MDIDYNQVKNLIFFEEMSISEIEAAILSLDIKSKKYRKNSDILPYKDNSYEFGALLYGSLDIIYTDIWNNSIKIDSIETGKCFLLTPGINYISRCPSQILYLYPDIFSSKKISNRYWTIRLLSNILKFSVDEQYRLSKILLNRISPSVRRQIMTYLSIMSLENQSIEFDIPFDRAGLATYLGIDRTSLCKELSKLQQEGYLTTHKNHFLLHKKSDLPR
ncbi:MAG: helix-turn-helix domain-containing protein [Eubacterium sp.]|nr:helix-turn-helix domain-containing protein [Eubacterium sp.]